LGDDSSTAILHRGFQDLVWIPYQIVVHGGDRDPVDFEVVSLGEHGSREVVVHSRVYQVQASVEDEVGPEQRLHIGPELAEIRDDGICAELLGRGVVHHPVLNGDPSGNDLGRGPAPNHLSPDRVVGGQDHRRVVGGVEAVHTEIVPGKHDDLAAGGGNIHSVVATAATGRNQ
jgi:hypothetical protein